MSNPSQLLESYAADIVELLKLSIETIKLVDVDEKEFDHYTLDYVLMMCDTIISTLEK
jgi:hypothetical protein